MEVCGYLMGDTKPLVNSQESCVDDLLEGVVQKNEHCRKIRGKPIVTLKAPKGGSSLPKKKVSIVSGGGSGHEPFAAGYVGRNLLTSAVAGNVFASPSHKMVELAIEEANKHSQEAVLVITMNYTGDRLNFGRAVENCKVKGIKASIFITGDDCAMEDTENFAGKRGLCGTLILIKIVGALAGRGGSLQECLSLCNAVSENISTLGVALSGCHIPGHDKPLLSVGKGSMELGLGIHGEAGIKTVEVGSTKEVVKTVLDVLVKKFSHFGDVVVMINNLGGLTEMEMLIIGKEITFQLNSLGFKIRRIYADHFMTSLNMRGFHISLLNITHNDEWLEYLDVPTDAPAWPKLVDTSGYLLKETTNGYHNGYEGVTNGVDIPDFSISDQKAEMIKRVFSRVVSMAPSWTKTLNSLDSECGDGDCGTTLENGAKELLHQLDSLPFKFPIKLLLSVADIIGDAMGGTSGAIYSIFFPAMASKLSALLQLKDDLQPQDWAQAFAEGVNAVSRYGGAKSGDRTMLDALYPAADVANERSYSNGYALIRDMSAAAEEGTKATAYMIAKAGRASYVRGGNVTKEDAGARAVTNVLYAILEAMEEAI